MAEEVLEEDERRCTNCTETMGSVYVECAECSKVPVDLCLRCFAGGAECGGHRRTHNYQVRNCSGVQVFGQQAAETSVWGSHDELALLDAVERYNLGNWQDVASRVCRGAAEARDHYDRFFVRGRLGERAAAGLTRAHVADATATEAQTAALQSPPVRPSVCRINPDDLRLLAYMPRRDDFEKEYQNDVENLVAKLLPMPDDDELDKAVKLAHVDMYVRAVAERRRLKAVARDYDLVPAFFKQEKPAVVSKGWQYTPQQYGRMRVEKQTRDSLRKFAHLLPAHHFDELVGGLQQEKLLKERIAELQKLRKNGVKSLEGRRKMVELGTPVKKRRGKKRLLLSHQNRRKNNRWQRIRRWQKKLAESD